MKIILMLLFCFSATAQVVPINPSDLVSNGPATLNNNFNWLNTHINGVAYPLGTTTDSIPILVSLVSGVSYVTIPNCTVALTYNNSTHTFSCPTSVAPSPHASTHAAAGSDAVSLDTSQITTGIFGTNRLPACGASGGSHAAGLVPDPGSSAGTTRFLREDCTWVAITGTNATQLQGRTLASTAPTNLQGLFWNNGANQWEPQSISFAHFNFTALGDLVVGGASGAGTRLPGDTSNTRKFLRELSVGGVATALVWDTLLAADVPTLNQNTTGTAANVTGVVAEVNGGTGANNTPGAAGHYLRSNATHYVDSAIQAADVPTLNQNTTGNANTATALATTPTQCSGGTPIATGIAANGNANCTAAGVGGSVFTGSTATATTGIGGTASAPTFSFADQSVKSPVRFEYTMSAAVTAPVINNKTAGAKADFAIVSDGNPAHTWSWNSIVADNVCPVYTAAAATTIATVEVGADGSTVHGIGCQLLISGLTFFGATVSAFSTAPGSGNMVCGMTANGYDCVDNSSQHWIMLKAGQDVSAAGIVTKVNGGSLPISASGLATNGSGQIIVGSSGGCGTTPYSSLIAGATTPPTVLGCGLNYVSTLHTDFTAASTTQSVKLTTAATLYNFSGAKLDITTQAASSGSPTSLIACLGTVAGDCAYTPGGLILIASSTPVAAGAFTTFSGNYSAAANATATQDIYLTLTAVGANLSTLTAGVVTVRIWGGVTP